MSSTTQPLHDSPHSSDADDSDDDHPSSDDDDDSDSTLSDVDTSTFGHPLVRIPRTASLYRSHSSDDPDTPSHDFLLAPTRDYRSVFNSSESGYSSLSGSLESLSLSDSSSLDDYYGDVDYEKIIDSLLALPENPFDTCQPPGYVAYTTPTPSTSSSSSPTTKPAPPLMFLRLPRTSPSLRLLLELNHHPLRSDPWNPAPYIRAAVERWGSSHHPDSDATATATDEDQGGGDQEPQGEVYLILDHLRPYNAPRLKLVSEWIDFFRQILEGLTFLHEHKISPHPQTFHPSSYMVDLSSAPVPSPAPTQSSNRHPSPSPRSHPHTPHTHTHTHTHSHHRPPPPAPPPPAPPPPTPTRRPTLSSTFDRTTYPVRYFFVDFTKARRIDSDTNASTATLTPTVVTDNNTTSAESDTKLLTRSKSDGGHSTTLDSQLDPFKEDIKACGALFSSFLSEIPPLQPNLTPLTKAMTQGGFTAEDARRLFEARIRALHADVFDMVLPPDGGNGNSESKPKASPGPNKNLTTGKPPGGGGDPPVPKAVRRGHTISLPVHAGR